jgi:hypothetical protein
MYASRCHTIAISSQHKFKEVTNRILTKSAEKYRLANQSGWSGSCSRLYILPGSVNELENCLLKAQSEHACVSAAGVALFLLSLARERSRGLVRCKKSIGKKEGLAMVLATATIASSHCHEGQSS